MAENTVSPANLDELIELRARAIHRHDGLEGVLDWEMVPADQQQAYLHLARATVEADEAAGVRAMPRKATKEMWDACAAAGREYYQRTGGNCPSTLHAAMWDASPFRADR